MVMDHHCRKDLFPAHFIIAWINNCVGLKNHGYFLLYVTYLALSCALAIKPILDIEL